MEKLELRIGKLVSADVSPENVESSHEDYTLGLEGHCLVCGESGSGKTVLFKDLAEEALFAGCPCFVIDPKGDLAQLAWPYSIACQFEKKEELDRYPERYRRFGMQERQKEYGKKLVVELFDHNYNPSRDAIKWAFTPRYGGLTPITIVSLHLVESEEARKRAALRILTSLHSAVQDLESMAATKFLFMDEAHRFSNSNSPEVNAMLSLVLRETCRPAKLKVCLSTHAISDYGNEFVSTHGFKHIFPFENKEEELYKCKILHYGTHLYREKEPCLLLPRWPFTIHRTKPISPQEFYDTMRIWEVKSHPIISKFSTPSEENRLLLSLNETDFKILSCVNDVPITHTWNALGKIPEVSENKYKSIVDSLNSNKELRNYGHYHAWLDYERLGFPITAFFVAKGRENWQDGIQDMITRPEIVEFYEIKPHKYLDVNLICKLKFQNMRTYNDFVCTKLLKISERGMSREKLCKTLIEEYKEGVEKDGEAFTPEIPPEQLVSGCVCARTFFDHPTCYIQDNTIDFLDSDQIKTLRRLLEIEDTSLFLQTEKQRVQLDLDSLSERIVELCGNRDLKKADVLESIRKMVDMHIIKGAYFELPWEESRYETTFVLGQLNFEEDVIDQAAYIAKKHQVQEVHTIAGTYDILVKLRGHQELNRIQDQLRLKDTLLLEVVRALKVGFRFRGGASGLS